MLSERQERRSDSSGLESTVGDLNGKEVKSGVGLGSSLTVRPFSESRVCADLRCCS